VISQLDERVQTLKQTITLSSIVGERVKLRREGSWFRGCCPFHDDSTPSFWVNDESGKYGCFGCGESGDLIDFVQQSEDCTCLEALDRLEGGYAARRLTRVASLDTDDLQKRIGYARKIWRDATPINGTPAEAYLRNRALRIENLPDLINLRFSRLTFEGSAERHPTLLAAIQTVDGEFAGIQRTYLTARGQKLDAPRVKRSLGALKGNAIRIDSENARDNHVYLTEGLETGLSVARMYDDGPVLVTAGAGMMPYVNLPSGCQSVTIAADNDEAGQKAADRAADTFGMRGLKVFVMRPDWRHKDWNDHVQFWDGREVEYIGADFEWARG
jgi:DNA primase